MSKSNKQKTSIYTSKRKRAVASVLCIVLVVAMVVTLLLAAVV